MIYERIKTLYQEGKIGEEELKVYLEKGLLTQEQYQDIIDKKNI